jgi:hypothetical protein
VKPISEAPRDGRPILAVFEGRPPKYRYCVMYWNPGSHCFYSAYGDRFIGPPSHFIEIEADPNR